MSLLSDGFEFLKDQLLDTAATPVTINYASGSSETIDCIVARSSVYNQGNAGQRMETFVFDVLVPGSSGYTPARTDRFVFGGNVYVIVPLGEELYRWDDPYHTIMRVHVQQEGVANGNNIIRRTSLLS